MTLGPQFDIFGKERMSGSSMSTTAEDIDEPVWGEDFRAMAADATVWPGESRFFAAAAEPTAEQEGQSYHPYATMQVTESMELPNFTNSREHGNQALIWEEGLGGSASRQSREVGKPPPFLKYTPEGQAKADLEQPSEQLFTHVPGKVNQAEVHPSMKHAARTLGALAHRDLPNTVPAPEGKGMPGYFSQEPIYISTGDMMDTATANENMESGATVRGRMYSDAEVRNAQGAKSRRQHFGHGVQGEQGKLF